MKRRLLILLGLIVVSFYLAGCEPMSQNSNYNNNSSSVTPTASSNSTTTGQPQTVSGYSGQLLAGNASPYLAFQQADYDKALSMGKIVFLDFYANWCPLCRAEAPNLKTGFDSLTSDKVVGFRVNFNDSDTDENEKMLAKKFGVTYQHTKVLLKDGKVVLKDGDTWEKDKFLSEINKL